MPARPGPSRPTGRASCGTVSTKRMGSAKSSRRPTRPDPRPPVSTRMPPATKYSLGRRPTVARATVTAKKVGSVAGILLKEDKRGAMHSYPLRLAEVCPASHYSNVSRVCRLTHLRDFGLSRELACHRGDAHQFVRRVVAVESLRRRAQALQVPGT